MKLNFNTISIIWMVSAVVVLFNAWISFSRSRTRGSKTFALFNVAIAWYVFFAAFELMSTDVDHVLFFTHLEYIGLAAMPALMLSFAFEFLDVEFQYRRPLIATLGIIGLAVMLLQWTTLRHGLVYIRPHIEPYSDLQVIHFGKGPVYILWTAILGMSVASAATLFIRAVGKADGLLRKQLLLASVGFCLPLVVFVLYVTSVFSVPYDVNPFSFIVVSVMTTVALFGTGMFNFAPVARERVFMSMGESCVILDENGRIVDMNPRAKKILPILNADVIGRSVSDVFSMFPSLARAIVRQEEKAVDFDASSVGGPARLMAKISLIKDGSKQNSGYLIVFEDTSERHQMIAELERYATMDDLTGLNNRRHFFKAIRPEVEKSIRNGMAVGLIMIDVDDFKNVNDVHGHALGDQVLRSCARTMAATIGTQDILCRFGGDEFLVFMPDADIEKTQKEGERLRSAIASMQPPWCLEKQIHISVGISAAPISSFDEIESLISKADSALYRAKRHGGNQVSL
jgi:diguanylate cyclase (GGDEF)-like protein/PAS domain S-box-containing protein